MDERLEFWTQHAKVNTQWVRIFIGHVRTAQTEGLRESCLIAMRERMAERRWARHNLIKGI